MLAKLLKQHFDHSPHTANSILRIFNKISVSSGPTVHRSCSTLIVCQSVILCRTWATLVYELTQGKPGNVWRCLQAFSVILTVSNCGLFSNCQIFSFAPKHQFQVRAPMTLKTTLYSLQYHDDINNTPGTRGGPGGKKRSKSVFFLWKNINYQKYIFWLCQNIGESKFSRTGDSPKWVKSRRRRKRRKKERKK